MHDNDMNYKGMGAVQQTAITGSAQTFNPPTRAIYIQTTGNIIGKLENDSVDSTWSGMIAGMDYSRHYKSITSATAAGLALR